MFDIDPVTSPLETDCGPTCMKMLLGYYGQDVTLDEMIKECNTGISGCSGKDMLRVGRAHGLDMHAYKMDAEELVKQNAPAICWWKYNHWVVFSGRDDEGKVVICNPDLGRYRMSVNTFKSMYTEVSIFGEEPRDMDEGTV